MHWASFKGHKELVEFLLDRAADASLRGRHRDPGEIYSLHDAVQYGISEGWKSNKERTPYELASTGEIKILLAKRKVKSFFSKK